MSKAFHLRPPVDRDPLRVMFVITSMPVGGAETLLVNLVQKMDSARFSPQVCCLKEPGPLGVNLSSELPVHSRLLVSKYDVRVLPRLIRLFRHERIDAMITVGAGDKMFWGRIAARCAEVPVIASALHSTGWPDGVGRLNRMLTSITDAFIAVAPPHGEHLVHEEGFPEDKVVVIPNGVDTERFIPALDRPSAKRRLGIAPDAPTAGLVAALRPEKNHELFLSSAAKIIKRFPRAQFIIVGEGPRRTFVQQEAKELGIAGHVHFLGNRSDVAEILPAMDVFLLTSHNEANPVSILEAMSCGRPVVATDVGSIRSSVQHEQSGFVVAPGDATAVSDYTCRLLADTTLADTLGARGRQLVEQHWSLDVMVAGYENLITRIYCQKANCTCEQFEHGGANTSANVTQLAASGRARD